MKIALASKHFINGDIKQNLSTIEASLKEVFSHRVDFLCFGEAFLQGFDSLSFNYENDQFMALTLDSQEINQLKQLAKTYQIGLGIGYLQLEKNKIYCSYLILDKNGDIIQNFKRVSTGWKYPDTDPIHYQEGTEFQTFTYLDKTFTIGLCGDFWDEKNVSSVSALKTDIIL